MSKRENKPVVSLATNDAGMECGDTSPLSDDETCLVVPKRGQVRALQTGRCVSGMECGGMTPLSDWATCRPVPKRRHVCALQRWGALAMLWLMGMVGAQAAVYTINQSGGVQGTAVNANAVIGAGYGQATAVNLTNGTQTILGTTANTIDAGQYDDNVTMYLDNEGVLTLLNMNGTPFNVLPGQNTFNVNGITAVSSAVSVGGVKYAVLAGSGIGVELLNLSNGALTPLPHLTNDLTRLTGLDAFLRPGGSTVEDLAIGELFNYDGDPQLEIYYPVGTLATSVVPTSLNGVVNDLSFDMAHGKIWFGTQSSAYEGSLFDEAYDFSSMAVSLPVVSVVTSNGLAVVTWQGRVLSASSSLTNWADVATAPATANQILPPAAYVEPATNQTRFFRASW